MWQGEARKGTRGAATFARKTQTEEAAQSTAMGKTRWSSQEKPDSEGEKAAWAAQKEGSEGQSDAHRSEHTGTGEEARSWWQA